MSSCNSEYRLCLSLNLSFSHLLTLARHLPFSAFYTLAIDFKVSTHAHFHPFILNKASPPCSYCKHLSWLKPPNIWHEHSFANLSASHPETSYLNALIPPFHLNYTGNSTVCLLVAGAPHVASKLKITAKSPNCRDLIGLKYTYI